MQTDTLPFVKFFKGFFDLAATTLNGVLATTFDLTGAPIRELVKAPFEDRLPMLCMLDMVDCITPHATIKRSWTWQETDRQSQEEFACCSNDS